MRKVWVVVANSSLSKIYKNQGNLLVEYKTMEHPESRLKRDDLVTDKRVEDPKRRIWNGHDERPYLSKGDRSKNFC